MPSAITRAGRPTKLTKKRAETICSYIRMGSYIETAAEAAGICKQSFFSWLNRGNDVIDRMDRGERIEDPEDKMYAGFVRSVNRAVAQSEINDLKNINKAAAEGIWQAAAWRLERRYPERWAKQEQLIINNVDADTYIEQQFQTLAVLTGERKTEAGEVARPANQIIDAGEAAGSGGGETGEINPVVSPPATPETNQVSEP